MLLSRECATSCRIETLINSKFGHVWTFFSEANRSRDALVVIWSEYSRL